MNKLAWLAALSLYAFSATAVELELGPVSGALNTRIALGAAMRTENRDDRLIAKLANPGQLNLCDADNCQSQTGNPQPNQRLVNARGAFSGVNEDNGNLNYDKGDFTSAPLQVRPKLELGWNGWQLQAAGVLFYDFVNANFQEHHADTEYQPSTTPRPKSISQRFANGNRIGNLFVAKSFEIDQHELLLKVGNQALNWGEANLVQFNTLSEWAPLDATALAMPGAEPSQLQLATPLASASFSLTESLSLEGVYQLRWRGAKLPASGSFLSTNDVAGGGEYAILGLGNFHEDPNRAFKAAGLAGLISQSTRTIYIPDEKFGAPRNNGQFGFRLNYLADWLNNGTELAFEYMHYHSRYPLVSGYAADDSCTRDAANSSVAAVFVACDGFKQSFNPIGREPLPADTARLFLDYPEDINLFGLSFNTNVGDWAFSGEYGFRPNQPLQILQSDVLFATLGPAFPAQDIYIGANSLTDPSLLAGLPAALSQPLASVQSQLQSRIPAGSGFTLPGENNAVPDFLSRYRGQTIHAGDYVRGYEREKVSQLSLAGIRTFANNPIGASQVFWVLEGAVLYVHDLPPRGALYFEGAGDRTHPSPGADGTGSADGQPDSRRINPTQMTTGFGSAFSWGYRSLLRATYNDLPFGITLNPALIWLHDIRGTSPAPIANFVQGRRTLIGNLTAEFKNDWTAGINYQVFDGAGTRNRLSDRDNVSAYIAKVF